MTQDFASCDFGADGRGLVPGRPPNDGERYLLGNPKLKSASFGSAWVITSNISFAGVMPDKSAPGRETDCSPSRTALGSPDDMSPLGGNNGSK
jgi:hypothetical protein